VEASDAERYQSWIPLLCLRQKEEALAWCPTPINKTTKPSNIFCAFGPIWFVTTLKFLIARPRARIAIHLAQALPGWWLPKVFWLRLAIRSPIYEKMPSPASKISHGRSGWIEHHPIPGSVEGAERKPNFSTHPRPLCDAIDAISARCRVSWNGRSGWASFHRVPAARFSHTASKRSHYCAANGCVGWRVSNVRPPGRGTSG